MYNKTTSLRHGPARAGPKGVRATRERILAFLPWQKEA